MGFISPCSKLERALRAFLILQGKATLESTFISNDARERCLPNRTILASGFSPRVPHRQEGEVFFSVRHYFNVAPLAQGEPDGAQRAAMDAFVGASADSLTISDGNSLQAVADGITAAGRWLAQPDGTPEGDAIAAKNADMANFRCDWVKLATPFLSRGGKEDDKQSIWVESLNFSAFVSQAATDL